MKNVHAFTFIELITFIVVMAIAGVAILMAINAVLVNAPQAQNQSTATQIASTCLDGYLGKRYLDGYSSITSSSTPALCSAPSGYSISKTVTNTTLYGGANYKTIAVTVSGKGNATISLIIADY